MKYHLLKSINCVWTLCVHQLIGFHIGFMMLVNMWTLLFLLQIKTKTVQYFTDFNFGSEVKQIYS